jgi:hypothetical protein
MSHFRNTGVFELEGTGTGFLFNDKDSHYVQQR